MGEGGCPGLAKKGATWVCPFFFSSLVTFGGWRSDQVVWWVGEAVCTVRTPQLHTAGGSDLGGPNKALHVDLEFALQQE